MDCGIAGEWLPFKDWTVGDEIKKGTSRKAVTAINDVSVALIAYHDNICVCASVNDHSGEAVVPLNLLLIDMFTEGGYARELHMLELRKLRQTLDDIILAGEFFQEQEGKQRLKKDRIFKTLGKNTLAKEPKNRK